VDATDVLQAAGADAAAGFGVPFAPAPAFAARVVHRLFPWAPGDLAVADPWAVLLWCNGRAPLGERPRRVGWRWHCAPLEEWDGRDPAP
jgi:predicted component of type VI protein secretion system